MKSFKIQYDGKHYYLLDETNGLNFGILGALTSLEDCNILKLFLTVTNNVKSALRLFTMWKIAEFHTELYVVQTRY